jgi:Leucine-rich repeat (LRR) protein
MKTKLLVLLFLASLTTYAQYTTIPDVNFEKKLITLGIDSGPTDGRVLTNSINKLTSLNVSSSSIVDLTGIQDFVALKTLNCYNNELTSLDVSKNIALTSLNCKATLLSTLDITKNIVLGSLDISVHPYGTSGGTPSGKFISLDLSKNIALTTLTCDNNPITTLDISKNLALTTLSCVANKLTSLDLSKNLNLKSLYCESNAINSLDVTNNIALTDLNCRANLLSTLNVTKNILLKTLDFSFYSTNVVGHDTPGKITYVDISQNTSLESLSCDSNPLTILDLSKNPALKKLSCRAIKLTSLDLTNNLNLENLICDSNQINSLDFTKNLALKTLSCLSNKLTNLDISKNVALTDLYCYSNLLTNLDLSKNVALTDLNCSSNMLTSLNLKNGKNTLLRNLYFKANPNLTCIKVDDVAYSNTNWANSKEYFAFFSPYDCNAVTNIPNAVFEDKLIALGIDTDGKNGVVLNTSIATITSLNVSNSSITDLTGIQGFTALTTLNCSGNLLKKLDLSKNTTLTTLNCSNNPTLICIQVADVAAAANWAVIKDAIASYSLDCTIYTLIPDAKFEDKLIALGIDKDGKNGKVVTESISHLTTLDVSRSSIADLTGIQDFVSLIQLDCYNNKLTSIDVTMLTTLIRLDCSFNQLSSLDISKNIALKNLICYNNLLTVLDLSTNTNLDYLLSSQNQLTALDVSNNVKLFQVWCHDNKIKTLDFSKNPLLTQVLCSNNSLVSLNIKNGKNTLIKTNDNGGVRFNNNPDLKCIVVDDITYSNTNWSNKKDSFAFYSPFDCSTVTQIPDAKFEDKLIALNIDTDGKNGFIMNPSIASISSLDVSNSSISNLTGIQGFTTLTTLSCTGNLFKKIDLSKNTALTTLNCSNNTDLTCIQVADITYATANWTTIKDATASYSLDCTIYTLIPDPKFEDKLIALQIDRDGKNGKIATENIASLTSLDVSNSSITDMTGIQDFVALTSLSCNNNQISHLNISKNVALTTFYCSSNNLTSLNLKNGKNSLLTNANISLSYNPNLKCILVDDVTYANANWSNRKDATATFNTDCTPYTLIPDANFEDKLIALGIDKDGKNGKVVTASIASITTLEVYSSNIASLTGIQDFVSLTYLDCSGNALTALNVTKNTALTYLDCSTNAIITLDVSKNTALTDLYCNINKLMTLGVSKNLALNKLNCSENTLTTLDVSKNTVLTEINCYKNSLTSLNLKNGNNVNMKRMYFANLAQNSNLQCIQVDNATFCNSNWEAKDASAGYSSDCTALLNTYTTIPDGKFEDKLIALNIDKDGKNGKVLTANISKVGTLDVSNSEITDLTGIQDFKMLTSLTCGNNAITTLDVSKNQNLDKLYCSVNKISNLDLTNNTVIRVLSCSFNLLTTLNVSANKSLKELECSNNNLSYLNIQNGNNANMQNMNFGNFTTNPNLTCILVDDAAYSIANWAIAKDKIATYNTACVPYTLIPDSNFENQLIAIGIDTDGKNGKVKTSSINTQIDLDIRNSSIADMTGIQDFIALKNLNCSGNLLTSIDVSKNVALINLFCEENQLPNLNISQNIKLDYLSCYKNQLTSLDVSKNEVLTYLSCGANLLTNLDVSKNSKLTSLYCDKNKLVKLNVKNGNNTNTTAFMATNNPNLSCIQVDDANYASGASTFFKDATATYSSTCGTLGIEDSVSDKIAIYPNPTKGELHIDNIVLKKATVYDALGKLVKTTTFTSGANDNTIYLTGLPKGVYYVYLESEGSNTAKKIIVE